MSVVREENYEIPSPNKREPRIKLRIQKFKQLKKPKKAYDFLKFL